MADERESHATGDKEYAYQEPNILKRYDDGFIIREMNYEDIRYRICQYLVNLLHTYTGCLKKANDRQISR